ncbi:MAG: hypothetical protein WD055_02920 [Candidatus Dependentiae bacterium]
MNRKMCTLLICMLFFNQSFATQLIQGNVKPTTAANGCPANATETFNAPVQVTTYDRANGIFYVGLASSAGTYAVSSFQRTLGSSQIPRFKPRATQTSTSEPNLNNESIALLAMATDAGDTSSRVAGVSEGTNTSTKVFILDITNKVTFSPDLKLYNPTLNEDGNGASTIHSIAANRCFIFATVSGGVFSEADGGIAVIAINQENLSLNQTAAVPGDMGIKAQQFNNNSPQLKIGNSTIDIQNDPILLWDDQLERLYAGASIQIEPQVNGAGGISVVVGTVGTCPEKGTLTIDKIAPNNAFDANNHNNIVGDIPDGDANLTVEHLEIMHCSTGPSYLIVHGGNGKATNRIFALPLVDKCDPEDPEQGKLANKNAFDVATHRFRTPATAKADLVTSSDLFAQVGNGPLPILPTQTISDIQVIGDAVYVSLKIPQDAQNETGILYSQAQFDNEGKIKSWTPWTKRVWPICGFPDSPSSAQVSFFAVDAVTGKVIAVDGAPQKTVRITEWDEGDQCEPCCQSCSLASMINRSLCDGAYSVLDLDQSTTGLGQSNPYRYALFGGTNKVDFALTSTSKAPGMPYDIMPTSSIPYPQAVTIDYCCPDFFLETELPDAGCVNTLEYARRTENQGDTNYFFAGTDKGLYAFAKEDKNGFNVTEFDLLCSDTFQDAQWHKISALSAPIVDIKTSGNTLYVMTFTTSCELPFYSEIKRINFEDNLDDMFDSGNIVTIARSTTSSTSTALQKTLLFTQMEIMQTSANGSQEQLVLTTNNGIFQSKRTNGVQDAMNETQANWTLIQNKTLFYGMGAIDNATIMSTLWPFSAQDACGCKTFERSSIHQLNGQCDMTPSFSFVPTHFNHLITCDSSACESQCDTIQTCCCTDDCPTPCEEATTVCSTSCEPCCCVDTELTNPPCDDLKLFEKICYFWSDGGRRFFIISPSNAKLACVPCCGKKSCNCCPLQQLRFLEVTPFNTCVWNVCDPLKTVLKDCVLRDKSAFYWVRPIGMTGVILAGTQSGVVALE